MQLHFFLGFCVTCLCLWNRNLYHASYLGLTILTSQLLHVFPSSVEANSWLTTGPPAEIKRLVCLRFALLILFASLKNKKYDSLSLKLQLHSCISHYYCYYTTTPSTINIVYVSICWKLFGSLDTNVQTTECDKMMWLQYMMGLGHAISSVTGENGNNLQWTCHHCMCS